MPIPKEYRDTPELRKKFYNEIAYEGSDIDIFLYGLNATQAKTKVKQK